ncbi:MAG: UDP-3-O-acyl-N-acetylglucosamine deacetylase [bacterium]
MPGRTIARPVRARGTGLFSRRPVEVLFTPAAPGTGIVFAPGLEARPANARSAGHCTELVRGGRRVRAVEHLLAACHGLGITDLGVDCPQGEPPFDDGSSRLFARVLRRAGLRESGAGPRPLSLRGPLLVEDRGSLVVARPGRGLRLVCVTDFPWRGPEACAWRLASGAFERGLAGARTVAYTSESPARLRRSLGLRFGLARRDGRARSPGRRVFVAPSRARMPGEACRHKLLDLLGDLALVGRPLNAEILAFRPGHRLNLALARRLDQTAEEAG